MQRDVPRYIKELAGKLRKEQTEAEKLLWAHIRKKSINGYRFRRQHPIGRYIADFYCPELRLVIEVDGGIHNIQEQKDYDVIREQAIENRSIKIIRFTNEEIFTDLDGVISKILEFSKAY